jgi:hypothetical protein
MSSLSDQVRHLEEEVARLRESPRMSIKSVNQLEEVVNNMRNGPLMLPPLEVTIDAEWQGDYIIQIVCQSPRIEIRKK